MSKAKKSVNSKNKGNRAELELCKILTEHFGKKFSRSVGSGNRWSQVEALPEHALQTYSGDVCVPENFKWVLECKSGYDADIHLNVLDGEPQSSIASWFRPDETLSLWAANRWSVGNEHDDSGWRFYPWKTSPRLKGCFGATSCTVTG